MKITGYRKALLIPTVLLMLLTGCYPTGEISLPSADGAELSEQISNIVSGNEHLFVDGDIIEDSPNELPLIDVKVMEWDTDILNELFISQRTDLQHTEYPCDFFTDENYHLFEEFEGDAYRLVYEPGRLSSAIRDKFPAYGYGTLASAIGTYNFGDYFNDDSIELFSGNEAVNRVEKVLTELGVTNYSEPDVYPIKAEKANRYFTNSNLDYDEWSTNEEIYILRFPLNYNGINVTTDASSDGEIGGHGSYFVGSCVTAVVSTEDILSLECENIFSPNYSIGDSVSVMCDPQNAMKIATEYYDNLVLGDADITLEDMRLVYVPFEQHDEKSFTLIPMWKINASINRHNEDLMGVYDFLFIDAQTGNIIIW